MLRNLRHALTEISDSVPIRFYLCGPMTGIPRFNHPAFHFAAEQWRALGQIVISPAENFGGDTTLPRERYLRKSFQQVMNCDAVLVLEGWESSRGALVEVAIARELGIPIYHANACPELRPVAINPHYVAKGCRSKDVDESCGMA